MWWQALEVCNPWLSLWIALFLLCLLLAVVGTKPLSGLPPAIAGDLC